MAVIVYAAENQNGARLSALLGIALSGNPAVTTLAALAPYAALQETWGRFPVSRQVVCA